MERSLEIRPLGVQRFEDRFPGKRRRLDEDLPAPAAWRCNLTQLSQCDNLYFIAYGGEIFVYKPSFPSQALSEPLLIIPCQSTGLGHGYLDIRQPDCINNMLVTHLGTEEVIATVRDSGDVDMMLVRHIRHAIETRASTTLSIIADELKPIFQRNVSVSAWGLAIHTEARIIAVSSNSHQITIFKFALASKAGERDTDVTEHLLNGEANIPCIAFCNTGDDPNARWLLTTDINGTCRTIDIENVIATQSFRFGRQIESIYGGGYDRLNAGWAIMFLDTRSFHNEHEVHHALGLQEHESLPDARDNPIIWDLSKTARTVKDVSNAFILHGKPISTNSIDIDIYDDIDIVEDEESTSTMVDIDDEDEGTEDSISATALYGGERICGNFPRFSRSVALCNDLPCPILHTSIRNVYLLQPTKNATPKHWQPPFVGFASPLRQSIQLDGHALNQCDRLNMTAYIPALGVVVIASQKGRAMVLALTKLSHSVKYPSGMFDLANKTNYAMRVEAILPYHSQEKLNQRPFSPLLGIATSPMQGNKHEKKRWRLLMMYQDHTLLSYEIVRHVDEPVII